MRNWRWKITVSALAGLLVGLAVLHVRVVSGLRRRLYGMRAQMGEFEDYQRVKALLSRLPDHAGFSVQFPRKEHHVNDN